MGIATWDDKYSERVAVSLAPSALAAWAIGVMALASVALLWAMPGPEGLRILAATWVCVAGMDAFQRVALRRGPCAVVSFAVTTSGSIELATARGPRLAALRDGSFVAPWLTVIRWRAPGHWLDRTVVVLPDMLPPENFRRLRVLLRWR